MILKNSSQKYGVPTFKKPSEEIVSADEEFLLCPVARYGFGNNIWTENVCTSSQNESKTSKKKNIKRE